MDKEERPIIVNDMFETGAPPVQCAEVATVNIHLDLNDGYSRT